MSAQAQMRAMLDQLMGTGRDGDSMRQRIKFSDERVCKSHLLDSCPHDILSGTRMDLGECMKVHDLALRADYEIASKEQEYFFELDAAEHLQSFIADCDRRTELAKKRLVETQDEISAEVAAKAERVHELNEEIGKLLARAEQLGGEGNVDEAQEVLEMVEKTRGLKKEAEDVYRNSMPASSFQQQKLRVCEVCSAYLGLHDNDRRLADHFGGKLHIGFIEIREKLEKLRKAVIEKQERMRTRRREEREKDDEKEREWEVEREKEREQEREQTWEREREKERRRSRSRSGERYRDGGTSSSHHSRRHRSSRSREEAGERAVDRSGERAVDRSGERAVDRSGERAVDRSGERAVDRSGERAVDRSGERAVDRSAERAVDRSAERAVDRSAERAVDRSGERAVDRSGERAVDRSGERAVDRSGERAVERSGERAVDRSGERAVDRSGERAVDRSGDRAGERSGDRDRERKHRHKERHRSRSHSHRSKRKRSSRERSSHTRDGEPSPSQDKGREGAAVEGWREDKAESGEWEDREKSPPTVDTARNERERERSLSLERDRRSSSEERESGEI
ncbi:putative RNA-binding protein Luc7-like 2 [Gymnodraco acuticeps]|uniref:RNA-binding protein Luc7-like 2 n=1 Tax=Gymnodraco acuticeps TaxID=8218 RepID=A0A6P8T6F3_GYMAC|nr:putative RNA-binding protein Luc7-like 2 [Gymnodraco acuticeps]